MHIKVLGCSGGVGPGLRTTGLLINETVMIDAGTGVGDLSIAQMSRVTDVFLTHSHLDHVCGLAFMADNLFGMIDHPLRVHATAETLATLREHLFNWKLWPDFTKLPDEKNGIIRLHELPVRTPKTINGCSLASFEVLHTVPAVGYALDCGDGTFAFTGDTYANDGLWDSLNRLPRLDKLMIEVAFADEDDELARISRHFTPALLASELAKLKHRPELLLTHHKPGCEADIERECRDALQGVEYRHLHRGDIITL